MLLQDYGIDFDDHDHPIKLFQCSCGSKFCRHMKRSNSKFNLQLFGHPSSNFFSISNSKNVVFCIDNSHLMLTNLLQYFFFVQSISYFSATCPAYNDNCKIWAHLLFWFGFLLDSCYSSFSASVSDWGHLIVAFITVHIPYFLLCLILSLGYCNVILSMDVVQVLIESHEQTGILEQI